MHQDHYGKAMECLSLAERVREPAERIGLLAIAQGFLRLARHRDENCRRAVVVAQRGGLARGAEPGNGEMSRER